MAAEEKSIGRKLLSFFITEETATPANTSSQTPPPIPKVEKTVEPAIIPQGIEKGVVDKKFIDHFVQLLENSNLKGPDYFEYMQALKGLTGLGLSEEKQFQAAWASFKVMGGITDVAVLTDTAKQYIGILDTDRQGFLKDVENAVSQKVGGLKNDLKKTEEENENIAKQIIDLQRKIDENKIKINKLTDDISEQSGKITINKSNYETTYHTFVEQIKGDIAKIVAYLK